MASEIVLSVLSAESSPEVRPPHPEGERWLPQWTLPELALLLGCLVYLLGFAWWAARGVPFWMDEVLGWMLGADPSLHHMILAWSQGADGGGISFYLLERLWFLLFGASDASYRLFSALGFTAGFGLTWIAARQLFSAALVAPAMVLTWLFSTTFNFELSLARFYGLFVAAAALTVLAYVRALRRQEAPIALILLTFAAHLLLVSTHVLGVLYSGATLAALMVVDGCRKWPRPTLYLSIAAAWGILLPSLPAIRATTQVGKPYFWIGKPYLQALLRVGYAWSLPLLVAGLACLLAIAVRLAWRRHHGADLRPRFALPREHRETAWLLAAWLTIVGALFCYSRFGGSSVFLPRYFLPMLVPVTLGFSELLGWAWPSLRAPGAPPKPVWILLAGLFVLLGAADAQSLASKRAASSRGWVEQLEAALPAGVPVVFESAHDFAEIMHGRGSNAPPRYRFLLDWQDALDATSPHLDVTDYHLMRYWKNVGYFSGEIEEAKDFLRAMPEFLVVHDGSQRWLQHRILAHPGFTARQIGVARKGAAVETLWLVRRLPAGIHPPSLPALSPKWDKSGRK
jgi:hypothetical protein